MNKGSICDYSPVTAASLSIADMPLDACARKLFALQAAKPVMRLSEFFDGTLEFQCTLFFLEL